MMKNILRKCPRCGSIVSEVVYPNLKDVEDAISGFFDIVQCSDCNLTYLGRESIDESISNLYSKEYHAHEIKKGRSFYTALLRFRNARRLRQIPESAFSKKTLGLEMGCGRGDLLLALAERFPSGIFWGLEITPPKLDPKFANIKIAESMDKLPIPDSSLDFVILYEVIEHLSNPATSLEYIFKKLRPGGYLVGSTPRFHSFWRHIFGVFWAGLQIPRHRVFFNDETLTRELLEKGFSLHRLTSVFDPGEVPVSFLNWYFQNSKGGSAPRSRLLYIFLVFAWAPFQLILNMVGLPSGTIGFVAQKPEETRGSP